ncbi:Ras-related protein Rab-26 isoform X2 [Oopsacas minuta]|uniref:Ras-related protein Rab-26 isoform X2 n=1 Tax=Oopsacas minuta TaxID=111878 RepID=A0AAV7KE63_9METZ|nr:Ras-related protein Rab-26 isoform X2 [Oopsacas minuta]
MNLDTLSYMRNIKTATTRVLQSDRSGSWALIGYQVAINQAANKLSLLPINVIQEGDVWIELLLALEDDLIMYAFVKLEDMMVSGMYKTFLVHWIGEKVSENLKTECAPHLNEIRNVLPEFDHLISSMDVKDIQKKVHEFLSQTLSVSMEETSKLPKTASLPKQPQKMVQAKKEKPGKKASYGSCRNPTVGDQSVDYKHTRYKSLPHFKVSIIGNAGVGKTSIYCSYRGGGIALTSPHTIQPTTEIDQFKRYLKIGEQELILDVWDTAGQERFKSFASCWLRNAHVVLLVYDMTDEASFTAVSNWLATGRQYAKTEAVYMLVGNKGDLEMRRVVKEETATEFAEKNGIEYMDCSGLTGYNILQVFECIARRMLIAFPSLIKREHPQSISSIDENNIIKLTISDITPLDNNSTSSNRKCCNV